MPEKNDVPELTPAERKLLDDHRAKNDAAAKTAPKGYEKTIRWLLEEGFAAFALTDSKGVVALQVDTEARFITVRAGDLVQLLRRRGVEVPRATVFAFFDPVDGKGGIQLKCGGPGSQINDAALFPEEPKPAA